MSWIAILPSRVYLFDGTPLPILLLSWYGALAMGMLYESGEFLDVGLMSNGGGPRLFRSAR